VGVNRRAWLAVAAVSACLSCGGGAPATPTETVRRFLAAMDRSANDARELREAYELLDARAQGALRERAHKAETLAGRAFSPWEMLAQGRFRLRFAPKSPRGMREKVDGETAVVVVVGDEGERAEVPLVRERGRWRIRLTIPPLGGPDARTP
jgi:hypothetical protein